MQKYQTFLFKSVLKQMVKRINATMRFFSLNFKHPNKNYDTRNS